MSREGSRFRIEVSGVIDETWARWLGVASIVHSTNDEGERVSLLFGCTPDEPGLRGIMARLWDLNLEVLSIVKLPREGGRRHEEGN